MTILNGTYQLVKDEDTYTLTNVSVDYITYQLFSVKDSIQTTVASGTLLATAPNNVIQLSFPAEGIYILNVLYNFAGSLPSNTDTYELRYFPTARKYIIQSIADYMASGCKLKDQNFVSSAIAYYNYLLMSKNLARESALFDVFNKYPIQDRITEFAQEISLEGNADLDPFLFQNFVLYSYIMFYIVELDMQLISITNGVIQDYTVASDVLLVNTTDSTSVQDIKNLFNFSYVLNSQNSFAFTGSPYLIFNELLTDYKLNKPRFLI